MNLFNGRDQIIGRFIFVFANRPLARSLGSSHVIKLGGQEALYPNLGLAQPFVQAHRQGVRCPT